MSSVLAKIDERVAEIETGIASVAPLVHERARLLRARAEILGAPEPDLRRLARQRRISRTDVFEYLARHPGSRAGEIAAGLGVGQSAVSAHLYRGRGRLFARRAEQWYPVPAADEGGRLIVG
jgi:DNA-binding transcriptional ArsR family regulator